MALASLVVAVVALIVACLSAMYTKRQAESAGKQIRLMEEELAQKERSEAEERDWAERFKKLASQSTRINPGIRVQDSVSHQDRYLWDEAFNVDLQRALERYVVQKNNANTAFIQRNAGPHQLKISGMRDTIRKAEKAIEDFQKNNSGSNLKYYLGS